MNPVKDLGGDLNGPKLRAYARSFGPFAGWMGPCGRVMPHGMKAMEAGFAVLSG